MKIDRIILDVFTQKSLAFGARDVFFTHSAKAVIDVTLLPCSQLAPPHHPPCSRIDRQFIDFRHVKMCVGTYDFRYGDVSNVRASSDQVPLISWF